MGPTVIAGQRMKMTGGRWTEVKCWGTLKEGSPWRKRTRLLLFLPRGTPRSAALHKVAGHQAKWFKKSENKTEQLASEGRNPGKEGMREPEKGEPPNL